MKYNFDKILNRNGTDSIKYDYTKEIFGTADLLPMWVADMDFAIPPGVDKAIRERTRHPVYGYSLKPDKFNESVCHWLSKRHGWEIKEEWISFVPGVVPVLAMAVLSLTEPNDRIIVQSPVYFPFFNVIKGNHRIMLNNPLTYQDNRYYIDFEHLESIIDEKTRMIFLCSPHNPVGRVWNRDELLRLAEICLKHNITMVSDEIHQDIVYKPNKHIPLAGLSDEIAQKTITAVAPSKTFNLAGLAASVAIIPNKKVKHKVDRLLSSLHLNLGNTFGLIALQEAYLNGEPWLEELLDYLHGNYDYISKFMKEELPEIDMVEPEATFLLWMNFQKLNLSGQELKSFLVRKAKLGLNEGTMFGPGGDGFQRLNFGCPRQVIEEAMQNLKQAVRSL